MVRSWYESANLTGGNMQLRRSRLLFCLLGAAKSSGVTAIQPRQRLLRYSKTGGRIQLDLSPNGSLTLAAGHRTR